METSSSPEITPEIYTTSNSVNVTKRFPTSPQHSIFWVKAEDTVQNFTCPSCLKNKIKGPCEQEILKFLTCIVQSRKVVKGSECTNEMNFVKDCTAKHSQYESSLFK